MNKSDAKKLKKSVDFIEDKIIDFIEDADKESKVLDIASGRGYLVKILEAEGFKNIHCADINPTQFAFDKDKYHLKKVDANVKLPYKDKFFDIVISSETIEHLENPRGFLGELYRVCKPGGIVVLTTPNVGTIFSRIFFLFSGLLAGHTYGSYSISGHISVLPEFLLERFFTELKFKSVQKTYNCGYIPVFRFKFKNHLLNPLFGWITIYGLKK